MASRYPFAVIKEKLHARRGEVTDFAMGGRRLDVPSALADWMAANAALATRPATPDAMTDFRDAALSLIEAEYGERLDPSQVVPIPGGRVAMTAVAACALQPDDSVLVTEPGYPAFARLASHFHANVIPVPLDPQAGFAPDLSALTEKQRRSVKIYSLNYPNNPSGGVLDEAAQAMILNAAAASDGVVFNDNVYGPLVYDSEPSSLLPLAGNVDVVELHALTKLYPIGPQGASFIAGRSATVQKIATYAEFAWAPMSGLQIGATAWCFRDAEGRAGIREFFDRQLSNLRAVLAQLGFELYPTRGGIYALCKSPSHIAGQTTATAGEAAMLLMDEFDLAVVPFEQGDNHYLRFTSMYSDEDLEYLSGLGERLAIDQPA